MEPEKQSEMVEEVQGNDKVKEEIKQMGFTQEQVDRALEKCGNKQKAVEYLLAGEKMEEEGGEGQDDGFEDEQEDYKMIFVVRMDLKLSLNKIAQLVATGALQAYKQMQVLSKTNELAQYAFYNWSDEGNQRKIVVKANTEKDLTEVIQKAKQANINYVPVYEVPSKIAPPKVNKPASKKNKGQSNKKVKQEKNKIEIEEQVNKELKIAKEKVAEAVKKAEQIKEEKDKVVNEHQKIKIKEEELKIMTANIKMQSEQIRKKSSDIKHMAEQGEIDPAQIEARTQEVKIEVLNVEHKEKQAEKKAQQLKKNYEEAKKKQKQIVSKAEQVNNIKKELQKDVINEEQIVKSNQLHQKLFEQVQEEVLVLAAFGPAAESELDPLTKHFKLL